ncbi:polycystin-1 isoform X2 [Synchiropus splendidus]|uniref:polycystin-1 isoform X2 n=1 Tax=Synchiropus splendidus TaxID=270530 RepID=UPI00237D6DA1|nr:polycystin-1 isoform X2 [Synchiropus splendidus]
MLRKKMAMTDALHSQLWILLVVVIPSAGDEFPCPKGSHVSLSNLECYWLSKTSSTWPEAMDDCLTEGGDLAAADGPEVQDLIHSFFPLKASVWVWVRSSEREGSDQEQDPGLCTQMLLGSPDHWRKTPCSAPYRSVCEKKMPRTSLSSEDFLVGLLHMTGVYNQVQMEPLTMVPDSGPAKVEMQLFPGLWFSHAGQLTALELVVQPSAVSTRARLQILRPYCNPNHHLVPPGCSSLMNPFSCCSAVPLCNTTGACSLGMFWCHLLEACIPTSSPCSPYITSAQDRGFTLPPRYPAIPPYYHLAADLPLSFSPLSHLTTVKVRLPDAAISVYPDDIVAVQHTGSPGSFIHCLNSSLDSQWRQSYLSLRGAERDGWWAGGLTSMPSGGQWVDGVVCNLKMLYVDVLHGSTGHEDIFGLTQTETPRGLTTGPSPNLRSNSLSLHVIHPLPDENNQIHVQVNVPTIIVVKILSAEDTKCSWSAPGLQTERPFLPSCPAAVVESGCERESDNAHFSSASLTLKSEGVQTLMILAQNDLTAQRISVDICGYEPVTGLNVSPNSHLRMIVDLPQSFTAKVDGGTSVRFSWVIDDLETFAHEGESYSVVLKKADVYKLKVTAFNPISSKTKDILLRAEEPTPFTELEIILPRKAVAVNESNLYKLHVRADASLPITLRWNFGDASNDIIHKQPVGSETSEELTGGNLKQMSVEDMVNYTYRSAGNFTIHVQVANLYETVNKSMRIEVRPHISHLHVSCTPLYPTAGESLLLESETEPGMDHVVYTWNLSDDTGEVHVTHSNITHTFLSAGVYNITVRANNTVSVQTAWLVVEVVERISGLSVTHSGASELNSVTEFKAEVVRGTALMWNFTFGDGFVRRNLTEGFTSHVYKSPGRYEVKVTAFNQVSQANQSIFVEVFRLAIGGIQPTGCVMAEVTVELTAQVSGNVSGFAFHWLFGDGSPLAVVTGSSSVDHRFTHQGVFPVNVTVISPVTSVSYTSDVCVQTPISKMELQPSKYLAKVEEEVCFRALLFPEKINGCRFKWTASLSGQTENTEQPEKCYTFSEEGPVVVSVTASNLVSNKTATASVSVQTPVGKLAVTHGNKTNTVLVNTSAAFWVTTCIGSNVSFSWDFRDGTPLQHSVNVSHIFASTGEFTVTVTAANAVSQESTRLTVNVVPPLLDLSLQLSQPYAVAHEDTLITAVSSGISGATYHWTVDGSSVIHQNTDQLRFSFPFPGVHEIKVIAQSYENVKEATLSVDVFERIENVSIRCLNWTDNKFIPTQQEVLFIASVVKGSNVTYHWLSTHLNTQTLLTGSGGMFRLVVKTPGSVSVQLRALNQIGETLVTTSVVAVQPASSAQMAMQTSIVALDQSVNISVSVVTGSDLDYFWYVCGAPPLQTPVPYLLYSFRSIGYCHVTASVKNILSQSNDTKLFRVQEKVDGVDFKVDGNMPPFYANQSTDVWFHGESHKGSDLHWKWNVSATCFYTRTFAHTLSEEGVYEVSLNVSNGISWQVVSRSITVQNPIQGLELNISKSAVCTEEQASFAYAVARGSNVTFVLTFIKNDWFCSQIVVGGHYNTSGLTTGRYQVTLRAHNLVSSAEVSSEIVVVESIKGLKFVNSVPETMPALQPLAFKADADTENPLNYVWLFRLEGHPTSVKGQEVTFTPATNGSLTVSAIASNGVCTSVLQRNTTVEWAIEGVQITCHTERIFVGHDATFSVDVTGGDNLKYVWYFGDLAGGLTTACNSVNHTYLVTGKHSVIVNVSNSVSSMSTQLHVQAEELECSAPQVFLIQSQTTVSRSQKSFFEARVDVNCTAYKTTHKWELSTRTDCTDGMTLKEAKSPLLVLPGHFLDVGRYCLIYTVRLQGTPLLVQRKTNMTVVHSPLAALIKGGSARMWPRSADLVMDGSESQDLDVKPGEKQELQFLWTCTTENTTVPCFESHQIGSHDAVIVISSSLLRPETVYIFTLTILSAERKPTSATQTVTVTDAPVLSVMVHCESCSLSRTGGSSSIVLSGQCGQCGDTTQYKWIAEDQSGLTLHLKDTGVSLGGNCSQLVFASNVLQPGHSYTFTLTVSEPQSGRWGRASLRIENKAPHGGQCDVSPASDVRLLETLITFNCSGWKADDEEAQLIYTLQVMPCNPATAQCPVLTLYRSTHPIFKSMVPFGSGVREANKSVISVLLLVEDNQGGKVAALNRTVTVSIDGTDATEWLGNKTETELWCLVQHGNPQEIIMYTTAVASWLNQISSDQSREELRRRGQIRKSVAQALASLPISSIMDVEQISSVLAQCTAVPQELGCGQCQEEVLHIVKKMILVMKNEMSTGVLFSTGHNLLNVLGNSMAAASESIQALNLHSDHLSSLSAASSITLEALDLVGDLMRSLVHSDDHELLSLSTSHIRTVGFNGQPSDLMCTQQRNESRETFSSSSGAGPDQCPFKIPPSLTTYLNKTPEVVQVFVSLDKDLASHHLLSSASPPISTSLISMELSTPQGEHIPIQGLDAADAIQLMLPNKSPFVAGEGWRSEHLSDTCLTITLPSDGQLEFFMRSLDGLDKDAGLYISFNFSLTPGDAVPVSSGCVMISISTALQDNRPQEDFGAKWCLSLSSAADNKEETIFLSPFLNGTDNPLMVNLTSILDGGPVSLMICVFSSVCRYYDRSERRWSSEGLLPLEGSTLHTAHCLTHHLTMFGATLFVHPGAVVLLPPSGGPVRNVVAGLVCLALLFIHFLVGLIAHKLDHLDSLRLRQVPLCGRPGLFHYRVLTKTGWRQGAGTSAHVGISLYGLNKSGSRHLKRDGAFQRGNLDQFHVETDDNLGELWKIRIWHDNTGLDPSWFLQHVVVWDLQTDYMFFFLVDDWLSVENLKNGAVEKEVLASCPAELYRFGRVLTSQLLFGMMERHLWLSLWNRPAHSRFTRSQRVTCGALSLHLYLTLGALWYGAVSTEGSSGPVSAQLLFNVETVAMGMTTAVLVLPVQCLVCFIFRKVCSKVITDESAPASPLCHSVEMDVHLGQAQFSGPSFLSRPDSSAGHRDTPSSTLESKAVNSSILDFWTASGLMPHTEGGPKGGELWASCDSLLSVSAGLSIQPDSLPDDRPTSPAVGPAKQLKRKKALYMNDDHNLKTFLSLSEEDLLMSIAAETEEQVKTVNGNSDSGRDSPRTTSLFSQSRSSCSRWSNEADEKLLHEAHICGPSSYSKIQLSKCPSVTSVDSMASTFLPSPSPDSAHLSSTTRIGVARGQPSWLFPPWTLCVIYPLVVLLLAACLAAVGLYGSSFSQKVVLMWLVSALSAFLTSALLLEPLKAFLQALAFTLLWRSVDPEVEDHLALETTVVMSFGEDGERVHPPCGYGLLQAKEEARKVQALKSLMRHSVAQLLLLLLVLMVNYQDNIEQRQGRMLSSFTKQQLQSGDPNFAFMKDWPEAGQWINRTLVTHLHHQSSLHLVGRPRIQYRQTLGPGGRVLLGNSSAETRQILTDLHMHHWSMKKFKSVTVDFTHYHKESGLFVCVSIYMEHTLIQRVTASLSIYPLIIPTALSGPDLHVALMLVLLISGILILLGELWCMSTERGQYLHRGEHWLQLLQVSLSLTTSLSHLCYRRLARSCISQLGKQQDIHINFQHPAALAQISSQSAALLLTLLVLKLLGTLRFVQRWVVIGRVLHRAWGELRALTVLLLLLLLLCVQLGHVLFSSSVEDFQSLPRTLGSVLSMLRGRVYLQRLCSDQPVLGPVYGLLLIGGSFWFFTKLCGAILVHSHRSVRASMRCPAIEPQDYEMVEFFIKRLKLWLGLTKPKEFRHRVKFEGMSPSRSSQESRLSTLSSSSFLSSTPPRPPSSSLSVRSEDSSASEQGLDVQSYLDHLQPCVSALLSRFDRVNQIVEDVHDLEVKLVALFNKRKCRIRKSKETFETSTDLKGEVTKSVEVRRRRTGLLYPQVHPSSSFSFLSSLHSPAPSLASFSRARSSYSESESAQLQLHTSSDTDVFKPSHRSHNSQPAASPKFDKFPRRRAWHSGSSHSADPAQKMCPSSGALLCEDGESYSCVDIRWKIEQGTKDCISDGLPRKRTAWISEGPETDHNL